MTGDQIAKRLLAWQAGRPLPQGETLHIAVADPADILILVFLRMGGESSPWAIAAGQPGARARVFTVPEPRDRALVANMVAEFAPTLLAHLAHPDYVEDGADPGTAPRHRQVWLPNATHLEMLHFLNYAYTYARRNEDAARLARLNAIGRACGWLFREAQNPGQMTVMVSTEVLREAYAFPSEDARQGHLGFLLAWLNAKGDREAKLQAATEAEQHAIATTLEPDVERRELVRPVEDWAAAKRDGDKAGMERARQRVADVLEPELVRRFLSVEQAIDVMRRDSRRTNAGIVQLLASGLARQRWDYLKLESQIRTDPGAARFVPSPETDRSPATASANYFEAEALAEEREAALIADDEELRQRLVAEGKAIDGTIVEVKDEGDLRTTRPCWTVEADGSLPLHLREGETLCVVGLPSREVRIRTIAPTAEGLNRFEVEVTKLKTQPAGRTDVLSAASSRLRGSRVVLVRTAFGSFARRKQSKLREADVPGAWLTRPKIAAGGQRSGDED